MADVTAQHLGELQRGVTARDRDRLDQYFTSVRDLENRLQASILDSGLEDANRLSKQVNREDKEKLEKYIKENRITWPVHFDGKGAAKKSTEG